MHQRKAIYTLFIYLIHFYPEPDLRHRQSGNKGCLQEHHASMASGRPFYPGISFVPAPVWAQDTAMHKKSQLEDLAAFLSLLRRSLYFLQPGT